MIKIMFLCFVLLTIPSLSFSKTESGGGEAGSVVLYGKSGTTLVPLKVDSTGSVLAGSFPDITDTGGNVGIGSVTPHAVFDVTGTVTESASTITPGIFSNITSTLSGSVAGAVVLGLYGSTTISGSGTLTGAGHGAGLIWYTKFNGNGTIPLELGLEGVLNNDGGGTVSNGAMVAGNMNSLSNSSIYTLLTGFQPQLGGIISGTTIGTYADFYSPDFSAVTNVPSTRYSLLNIDAGKVISTNGNIVTQAGGNIGVGSLSPGQYLDVKGGNIRVQNGNIGIGTSPVNAALEISTTNVAEQIEGAGPTGYDTLNFSSGPNVYRLGTAGTSEVAFGVGNKMFVYDQNNTAMRVVIDTAGNVGIGSVNPGSKLDVQGGFRIFTATSSFTKKTAANQACNTTCAGSMCVFGEDTGVLGTLLACTDATADVCICAG